MAAAVALLDACLADKRFQPLEVLLLEKRVLSFRGKKLVEVLRERGAELDGVKAVDDASASAIASALLNTAPPAGSKFAHLFRPCVPLVDKAAMEAAGASSAEAKKFPLKRAGMYVLKPADAKLDAHGKVAFDPAARYYLGYTGSEARARWKLIAIVAFVFAVCMFQLWPPVVRTLIWYVSVTLLLGILGTTALQLCAYALGWLLGYKLWLLPNLWSDEPIWNIHKPLVTCARASDTPLWMRLAGIALLLALGVWVGTQPREELDAFLTQQKQFVDDLYAGTLLGDGRDSTAAARANSYSSFGYGKRGSIPKVDELEKMLDDERAPPEGDAPEAEEAEAAAAEQE